MPRFLIVAAMLALALIGGSCSPDPGKSTPPASSTTGPSREGTDSTPSKEEVLAYLNGKEITAETTTDKAKKLTFAINRANITALEIGSTSSRVGDSPWSSSCTFLYDNGNVRLAVEIDFEHRKVDNKRAFFGMHVKRVAEQ